KTRKHMLKSGRAYKKAYAVNPEHFVESATMFQTRIVAVPPVASNPEPVTSNPEPVRSNPEPAHPAPSQADDQTVAKQRELIQQLIRQEIQNHTKENPLPSLICYFDSYSWPNCSWRTKHPPLLTDL